jgi:hypothetical protein
MGASVPWIATARAPGSSATGWWVPAARSSRSRRYRTQEHTGAADAAEGVPVPRQGPDRPRARKTTVGIPVPTPPQTVGALGPVVRCSLRETPPHEFHDRPSSRCAAPLEETGLRRPLLTPGGCGPRRPACLLWDSRGARSPETVLPLLVGRMIFATVHRTPDDRLGPRCSFAQGTHLVPARWKGIGPRQHPGWQAHRAPLPGGGAAPSSRRDLVSGCEPEQVQEIIYGLFRWRGRESTSSGGQILPSKEVDRAAHVPPVDLVDGRSPAGSKILGPPSARVWESPGAALRAGGEGGAPRGVGLGPGLQMEVHGAPEGRELEPGGHPSTRVLPLWEQILRGEARPSDFARVPDRLGTLGGGGSWTGCRRTWTLRARLPSHEPAPSPTWRNPPAGLSIGDADRAPFINSHAHRLHHLRTGPAGLREAAGRFLRRAPSCGPAWSTPRTLVRTRVADGPPRGELDRLDPAAQELSWAARSPRLHDRAWDRLIEI